MSKLKKARNIFISSLLSLVLVGSVALLPYYQVKAEAITATLGVASGGVALLSLLALTGVGMELENNRKFNELTDEEKTRLENGLAQNFEEVALQRGASLEKIKTWTSDLCNGVLDKASECWDIFKTWAKNISISDGTNSIPQDGSYISEGALIGISFIDYNGNSVTIDSKTIDNIKTYANRNFFKDKIGYYIISAPNSGGFSYSLYSISDYSSNNYISYPNNILCVRMRANGEPVYTYASGGHFDINTTIINNNSLKAVIASKPVYPYDSSYQPITSINLSGLGINEGEFFSTNTDYLERLKGQDNNTVEVIDVTDIKHPIIESVPNTKAELSYNKGFRRPTPDDDDDDLVVGGLVPTNVYYEALDDYNEGLKNEIIEYEQNIQEHPENQDKIFVSPTPIINVNNIYNTLPVVNTPINNTVVNNNYTYNNTYNKNVTINELPYNAELIPYLPTMLFQNKFPFCIPFDIYTLFSVFYVEREAPEFTFDVPFPSENGLQVQQITLGLKDYEYCALVLRIMWYFLFLLGLMLISRKLIKG